MPPAPATDRISYGPSLVLGARAIVDGRLYRRPHRAAAGYHTSESDSAGRTIGASANEGPEACGIAKLTEHGKLDLGTRFASRTCPGFWRRVKEAQILAATRRRISRSTCTGARSERCMPGIRFLARGRGRPTRHRSATSDSRRQEDQVDWIAAGLKAGSRQARRYDSPEL
jgi:hypothetical protein